MGKLNCKTKNAICIGDLKHYITIQKRALKSPLDVDFEELLTTVASVWAGVKVVGTPSIFDKTNIEEGITHKFYIRYRTDVDINNWILYDNIRYKITLAPKDIYFNKKYLELSCIFKGSASVKSSEW